MRSFCWDGYSQLLLFPDLIILLMLNFKQKTHHDTSRLWNHKLKLENWNYSPINHNHINLSAEKLRVAVTWTVCFSAGKPLLQARQAAHHCSDCSYLGQFCWDSSPDCIPGSEESCCASLRMMALAALWMFHCSGHHRSFLRAYPEN